MKPWPVKPPLRLGPREFERMADTLKQHGIDINEMFDIERHTFGSTALPMTEYIVRKKETHNA